MLNGCKKIILTSLLVVLAFFALPQQIFAQDDFDPLSNESSLITGESGNAFFADPDQVTEDMNQIARENQPEPPTEEAKEVLKGAEALYAICDEAAGTILPVAGTAPGIIPLGLASAPLAECYGAAARGNAMEVTKMAKRIYMAKVAAEKAAEKKKEGEASTWKGMVAVFLNELAVRSATFITTGALGGEPLYNTEGAAALIVGSADAALGEYINSLAGDWSNFDLCSPDFSVSVVIKTSISGRRSSINCGFSSMIQNWRSAVQNPNFSLEWNNHLRAEENDIGTLLKVRTQAFDKQIAKVGEAVLESTWNDGWKSVKNFASDVLTPGTAIRSMFEGQQQKSDKKETTYTGFGVADALEAFGNTLMSSALDMLSSGIFSGGGGRDGVDPLIGGFVLPGLLDPEASPYIESAIAANSRFLNLIGDTATVGGSYDILNKLIFCSESASISPGPTDCVIDQTFARFIREKEQLRDLPESVLNRRFVPQINEAINPSEVFTLRNVLILRKYRIVPVGWEIAARYISQSDNELIYTLGDLMDQFNDHESIFATLVDPHWVLKVPELFCRREGYGENDILFDEQGTTLQRGKYCADEQQCIREDTDGNCLSYGYCTETRRIWNLNSDKCEPRFNTCQAFQSTGGETGAYLANTLDYRDCNSQNVGCRWYSGFFNSKDGFWSHTASEETLRVCLEENGCEVRGVMVSRWEQVAMSTSAGVIMSSPCIEDGGCDFSADSCIIPYKAVRCSVDSCLGSFNILGAFNNSFEVEDSAPWDALQWVESYIDNNNRQFRSQGNGRSGDYALQSVSTGNAIPLVTILPNITSNIETNTGYKLSFYARGFVSAGNIEVQVYAGESQLGRYSIANPAQTWQEYFINFTTQENQIIELRVVTDASTVGSLFLDDFSLRILNDVCTSNQTFLTRGVKSTTDKEIYFDNDAQACSSIDAGCTQFIRTVAGLGSNMIKNSGFEYDTTSWNLLSHSNAGIDIEPVFNVNYSGDYSLKFTHNASDGAIYSRFRPLDSFDFRAGHQYSFSAWVYSPNSPTTDDEIYLQLWAVGVGELSVSSLTVSMWTGDWQRISLTLLVDRDYTVLPYVVNTFEGGSVYFDDIQLEEITPQATGPSVYTPYTPSERPDDQLTYLKKAPDYFSCYLDTGGNWPNSEETLTQVLDNRDALCSQYSGVCIASEMDCELYTPVNGDPAIPGTITSADLCPAECDGYGVQKQEETSFASEKYEQFINTQPIQYCTAAVAGCDEFTNLDESVELGAEMLEYYTRFKVCQQAGDGDEAIYYTWEGNDTLGYQLKTFNLRQSISDNGPCTHVSYDGNGDIFCSDPSSPSGPEANSSPEFNDGACLESDLDSNLDCREFYDVTGNVYYRLFSMVIHVSDDCHPYRRTQTQVSRADAASDCRNNGGYWNALNECIYMAIPGQGGACSVEGKGCREYTGNKGNSFINISFVDFESGVSGWTGGTISAESTHPGGNSFASNSTRLFKNVLIGKNKAYSLSFWAKGENAFNVSAIRFSDAPFEDSFLSGITSIIDDLSIPISEEWDFYEVGPVFVSWESGVGYFEQVLEINVPSGETLYIDNIILKELPETIYAIENSWYTPVSCDNVFSEPYGVGVASNPTRENPGEMIGCQEYSDRAGDSYFLKSFENLCRRDAVGCEQLIDTHNSDSAMEQVFNVGDSNEITVSMDEIIYIVNDPVYGCNSDNAGCTAYGLPTINNRDEVVGYSNVYIKNQPERYATDLCKSSALWCEQFTGSRSVSYFKNPRDKVCEYKALTGEFTARWYKKGSSELCDVTYLQTLGTGTPLAKIQPVGWFNNYGIPSSDQWFEVNTGDTVGYDNWVGSCPVTSSSCTEYIDPITDIYKNEIKNSHITADIDRDGAKDYWAESDGNYIQRFTLKTNTLYSFSSSESDTRLDLVTGCNGGMVSMDYSMDIGGAARAVSINGLSGRFYIISNIDASCLIDVVVPVTTEIPVTKLDVVQSGVYYALSSNVDATSCNGMVDYNTGCVLFNDRGVINYSSDDAETKNSNYLTFDADITYWAQMRQVDEAPVPPRGPLDGSKGNSNVILNVQPDRECQSWLYCTTYEKDKTSVADPIYGNTDKCLSVGLCTSLDERGVCNNLVLSEGVPREVGYTENNSYNTGYSTVGGVLNGQRIYGYYPYDRMFQYGGSGVLTNGNFESTAANSTAPLGWFSIDRGVGADEFLQPIGWYDYKFEVTGTSVGSPEGSKYLRLNSFYEAESEGFDLLPDTPYVLTAWVNAQRLEYPDIDAGMQAQIHYQFGDNSWSGIWQRDDSLNVDAGIGWTKLIFEFKTPEAGVKKMKIRLKNFVDDGTGFCHDYNTGTECDLSGYSFFDDISVLPVLQVSHSLNPLVKYKTRSCRIYPTSDALSCRYIAGNNVLVGQYGYCLLPDPLNSKQCLQWWPVDQLEGEIINELGGYSDRVPLDYCISKKTVPVTFSDNAASIQYSGGVADVVAGFADDRSGAMNFDTFDINDSYRPLFRFPYVHKMVLNVFALGFGDGQAAIMIPVRHEITYDVVKREWRPWAIVPYCINGICLPIPIPYDIATSDHPLKDVLLGTGSTAGGFGPIMTMRIIDDSQIGSVTGSGVADPVPDVGGDILGYAWSIAGAVGADTAAVSMTISGDFEIDYCNEFTRVVTSSGVNKSYASRVSPGSGFINVDFAARPAGQEGFYYYYKPFDYNDFLDDIESISSYRNILPSFNPLGVIGDVVAELANAVGVGWELLFTGTTTRPTLYTPPLDLSNYQSSDYQPFGALVAPDADLDPANWSSRNDTYNMPLFYEPPRIGSFDPPYQARMGEIHSASGLKELFARSYGTWEWIWNKTEPEVDVERGGHYIRTNANTITIPDTKCVGERSRNECYIEPIIDNVTINDIAQNPEISGGVGLAKLEFTTFVDPNQLPITSYRVIWGDGDDSNVSGVTLRNKTNPENPFVLYHLYDLWRLKQLYAGGSECTSSYCEVEVKITLVDNWGIKSETQTIKLRVSR